jgi:uncharacterized protein (DUF1800 family)
VTFVPELGDIRFGCGLSPELSPPVSPQAMLDGLGGPDIAAERFAIPRFADLMPLATQIADLQQQRRAVRGTAAEAELIEAARTMILELRSDAVRWYGATVLRWTWTGTGLRERLVQFWADHFTAMGKTAFMASTGSPYVEEAIRPYMTGRFADLLFAVTTHPLMLHFLDQVRSVGPDSRAARRAQEKGKGKRFGLNENLAREVLELHTLGVGGPYSQDDVRQLAELFTGLSFKQGQGFEFRPERAEAGAETILGRSYGGDPASLDAIRAALDDIALHPVTARHIAWKLAVHFVSDQPDPALIDHVAARYQASGGDLMAVYAALLEHPAAWDVRLANVKPPADFIATTCRALAVTPERLNGDGRPRLIRRALQGPMAVMGQPWQKPGGPDGWPEEDADWITPQGLAARMRWAMAAPVLLRPDLPDPRAFVTTALGPFADERVLFAAQAAETREEAIGLILSAPAFQRR